MHQVYVRERCGREDNNLDIQHGCIDYNFGEVESA